MDLKDLKAVNTDELKNLLQEKRLALHGLKQKSKSRTLKQVHLPKTTRRTVARILTILKDRQPV
ncbi:MAG: 50S ribosomal protein L29 [Candidatus Magasanikbacteria bacterium]|nr:50S ribosomal protein L29 [Candidatus Magasanikbacteria bacterium]